MKTVPIGNDTVPFTVKRGSFYGNCYGGWQREFQDDDSVMFVFAKDQS